MYHRSTHTLSMSQLDELVAYETEQEKMKDLQSQLFLFRLFVNEVCSTEMREPHFFEQSNTDCAVRCIVIADLWTASRYGNRRRTGFH